MNSKVSGTGEILQSSCASGRGSCKMFWRLLPPSRTDSIVSQQKGVLQQLFSGTEESWWRQKTFLRLKDTKCLYLNMQVQVG